MKLPRFVLAPFAAVPVLGRAVSAFAAKSRNPFPALPLPTFDRQKSSKTVLADAQQDKTLAALAAISRIFSSSMEIDELFQQFADEARELIRFDWISITAVDSDQTMVTAAWISEAGRPLRRNNAPGPLSGTMTEQVLNAGRSLLFQFDDRVQFARQFPRAMPVFDAGMRSFLSAPLIFNQTAIGALHLRRLEPNAFDSRLQVVVEHMANQIAGAITTSGKFVQLKYAQEALQSEKERYQGLVETMPYAMSQIDTQGTILFANEAYHSQLEYGVGELIGTSIFDLASNHEEEARLRDRLGFLVKEQSPPTRGITTRKTSTGRLIDVEVAWNYNWEGSRVTGFISILTDITERKVADDLAKAALVEKETLLRETDNRVIYNMQMVAGLLDLQSWEFSDQSVRRAFDISQGRIKAMALVHEKLYRSEDPARIEFGDYLQSLVSELSLLYRIAANPNINLLTDTAFAPMDVEHAVLCGLVVNELIANSLKHAFPGGRAGEIRVGISSGADQYALSVRDNGVGFPQGLNFQNSRSLALNLINTWVGQLGGAIDVKNNGGADVEVSFSTDGDLVKVPPP